MLAEDAKGIKRRGRAAGNAHRWRGGERKGRSRRMRRWHVINRWSDKFKCFSSWQKIERLRE